MNAGGANVLRHSRGSDGDDLARVENSLRVEYLLEFAEHVYEWAVLFRQKWRAAQAITMFAADRAAQQPHFFVELRRERFHRADVGIRAQIQKRANVKLALSCVTEEGCRYLQMLKRVLHMA